MLLGKILLDLGFEKGKDSSKTHQDYDYRIDEYKVLTIRHFFNMKNYMDQEIREYCRFFYSGGYKDFHTHNTETEIKKLIDVLTV